NPEKIAMPTRGIRRTLTWLGCAAALVACSSDTTFPAELAGAYTLTSVNGSALPYNLPGTTPGTTARLVSGSLVLLDNGRFDEQLRFFLSTTDNPAGGNTQAQTIGDVSAGGGSITFKPRFEDSYSGTYTASTVTYTKQASTNVAVTLVFTRGN
ncbi:MAG TPA: hypothetical protein VF541_00225, partial [Longimicrobium sp.]